MSRKIGVIDYGAGNLLNVVNALTYCNADVSIIKLPREIKYFDRLVLPGVGAFQDGITTLKKEGFIDPLIDYISSGNPYLGICVGMQFLFEFGHEFGVTPGLGVVKGEVIPIPQNSLSLKPRLIPHVGWTSIDKKGDCPVLKDVTDKDRFYFVHSFMCAPKDPTAISSVANYIELDITASISFKNVFGTQFHPEKSGESGLKVLKNFLQL